MASIVQLEYRFTAPWMRVFA